MKALGILLAVAVLATTSAQVVSSQEANQDWERAHLQYELQKVDPWGPFVLNLLLNFGIGSFVQGDTTGGLIVAGGQILGIGLIVAGVSSPDPYGSTTSTLVYVGAGLAVVTSVAGYVFPFTYANAANEKLRRDLGISVSNVSLNEQGLNVTLAAALPYK